MDINSVGSVGKISTTYEKTLAADITNSVQSTSQPTPIANTADGGQNTNHDAKVDKEKLSKELDGLNKLMQANNTHLRFMLHDQLNEYYVEVIDDRTNEVIREVPSKKMMDMVAQMHKMIGFLVDEKR